jgi:hypothetical protein
MARPSLALAAVLLPALAAFVVPVPQGASPGGCINRQASTTQGPKLDCTTPTGHCQDNTVCNYLCTYTPPATNCPTTEAVGFCCQTHVEQAYTQQFVCGGTPPRA